MSTRVTIRGPRTEFHNGVTSGGSVSFTFSPPFRELEFVGVELDSPATDLYAVTARSNSGVTVSVGRLTPVDVSGASVFSSTLTPRNGTPVRIMASGT